jgi:Ser/Thr protein kinase RdoA (MazF antagonist)
VAREVYGIDAALTPLAGERDDNFLLRSADGTRCVLKILDLAADPMTVDCQVTVLRHLAEQDPTLPVPRLRATRLGAPVGMLQCAGARHSTLLIEYLPGQPLSASTSNPRLLRGFGYAIGRLDRALQGFFHPSARAVAGLGRAAPAGTRAISSVRLAEHARAAARRRDRRRASRTKLPALRGLPSQAIHGDCHASNVLIDAPTHAIVGIVDFGDMIHAPRVLEPAVAMSELLTEGIAASSK